MKINAIILIAGCALSTAGLLGQAASAGSSFQPPAWVHSPSHSQTRVEGSQSGPVLGKPFSATEVRRTQQTLSDGTKVDYSDVSKFYRDSQGRMRAESAERVEIFDFVAGVEYDLHPRDKSYQKIPIRNKNATVTVAVVGGTSVTGSTTGDSGRPQGEDLGTQVLAGLSAVGTRSTVIIPSGAFGNDRELKVVNERWYSPELQSLVKSSNTDPRFGVNTYELTNIQRTEPDPALFQPPAEYTLKPRHH